MEKPMSAKIVVSSSVTWLSGWMRPISAGVSGSGRVTSMVSKARRAIEGDRFQDIAPGGERIGDLVLGEIDRRALRLALFRRHLSERGQKCRDRALLAERGDPHGVERGFVAGGCDLAQDVFD